MLFDLILSIITFGNGIKQIFYVGKLASLNKSLALHPIKINILINNHLRLEAGVCDSDLRDLTFS